MIKDLERFYQAVTNEPSLNQQFESITERGDFIRRAVQLGAQKGYTFTASEVKASIEANTASEQGEYFCLPIGCWHNAQFA